MTQKDNGFRPTTEVEPIIGEPGFVSLHAPDDYNRVKVGTVYQTPDGDMTIYRWHEQYTYNYVHDPVHDLDQGFCREARELIDRYDLKVPDYTPSRPLFYLHNYDDNKDETTITPSVGNAKPLKMKGYWPTAPRHFKWGIYADQVLLKQYFPIEGPYPIYRWFYTPETPVTCPKLKLVEGFEERVLNDGLKKILTDEQARNERRRRMLQNVVTTTLPTEPDTYNNLMDWMLSPNPPKAENVKQVVADRDFVPVWVDDGSTINKEQVKKYYADLQRINLSKEWNRGDKPSLLEQIMREEATKVTPPPPPKHSYHITPIIKGKAGEFSKIEEEFLEARDALLQENKVMLLVELSDLLGAVECYLEKNFPGVTLDHVVKQAKATNEVFRKGGRVPESDPGTR